MQLKEVRCLGVCLGVTSQQRVSQLPACSAACSTRCTASEPACDLVGHADQYRQESNGSNDSCVPPDYRLICAISAGVTCLR
jgi:hypothetical protein